MPLIKIGKMKSEKWTLFRELHDNCIGLYFLIKNPSPTFPPLARVGRGFFFPSNIDRWLGAVIK